MLRRDVGDSWARAEVEVVEGPCGYDSTVGVRLGRGTIR